MRRFLWVGLLVMGAGSGCDGMAEEPDGGLPSGTGGGLASGGGVGGPMGGGQTAGGLASAGGQTAGGLASGGGQTGGGLTGGGAVNGGGTATGTAGGLAMGGGGGQAGGAPVDATADFLRRATGPGVVKVNGFDTLGAFGSDLVRCDVDAQRCNLRPRADGRYFGGLDVAEKRSGAGALRFHLERGYAAANIAGQFLPNTNDGLGRGFGENSVMYIQYAVRFSPEMFLNKQNGWDSSWKVSMFHMNQQSCGSKELATNAYYASDQANMYKDCGANGMVTRLDGETHRDLSPPYLFQQGDHATCAYGSAVGCFRYPSNEWVTLYFKVTLGRWGQPDSAIEAWYALRGQPYRKWINVTRNFTIDCNGTAPCPAEVFNNLTLTPYMTGLSTSASRDAYVWYDELIVSTQPIPAPGAPAMEGTDAGPVVGVDAGLRDAGVAAPDAGTLIDAGLPRFDAGPRADGGTIPGAAGWYELPATQLNAVCAATNGFPQVHGNTGCAAITAAWNGGAFDTRRNRLIIWGGGHADYFGNELYALDLRTRAMVRLNDPGLPIATSCTEGIVNGTQPNSRHTYDGVEYMENVDRLFVFGGSLACGSGIGGNDTWTFDFTTMQWQRMNPGGAVPRGEMGMLTAYDPVSGRVFLHDRIHLYAYDFAANTYTRVSQQSVNLGYHLSAAIDPVRRLFVVVGYDSAQTAGRVYAYDVSGSGTSNLVTWNTTGGGPLVGSSYPGLAYHPPSGRLIAYNGGATVYALDTGTRQWATLPTTGGPGALSTPGTMGRWGWSPADDVFVYVNRTNQNGFTFRLP